jgi:hypothetical protein
VRFWHSLLVLYSKELPPAGKPQFAETVLLGQIAEWSSMVKERWPAEAVYEVLQGVREEEKARECDSRALAWIKPFRDAAATRRREGEGLLLSADSASWEQAEGLLRDARSAYQLLNRQIQIVTDAHANHEEALARLPGYAAYLEQDDANLEVWEKAARTTRDLGERLAKPGGRDTAEVANLLKIVEGLSSTLRQQLDTLAQAVEADRLKGMKNPAGRPSPTAWRDIQVVLACTWLPAPERKALWQAGRDLSGQLHQAAATKDYEDDQSGVRTDAPSSFDGAKAGKLERERGLRRARLSVTLLKLTGLTDTEELDQALATATAGPADTKAWQNLRGQLRQAWNRNWNK